MPMISSCIYYFFSIHLVYIFEITWLIMWQEIQTHMLCLCQEIVLALDESLQCALLSLYYYACPWQREAVIRRYGLKSKPSCDKFSPVKNLYIVCMRWRCVWHEDKKISGQLITGEFWPLSYQLYYYLMKMFKGWIFFVIFFFCILRKEP